MNKSIGSQKPRGSCSNVYIRQSGLKCNKSMFEHIPCEKFKRDGNSANAQQKVVLNNKCLLCS